MVLRINSYLTSYNDFNSLPANVTILWIGEGVSDARCNQFNLKKANYCRVNDSSTQSAIVNNHKQSRNTRNIGGNLDGGFKSD